MSNFTVDFYSVTKIDEGLVFISEFEDEMSLNSSFLDDWKGEVVGDEFRITSKEANLSISYKNLSGVSGYLPFLLARRLKCGYVALLLHEGGNEDGYMVHVTPKSKFEE